MPSETQFEKLLAEHEQGRVEDKTRLRALQEQMTAALRTRYKLETGRRWAPDHAIKQPWYPAFFAHWREKADSLLSDSDIRIRGEQARLRDLADAVSVPSSDEEIEIERYCGSAWSTQGYGANAYAKGMAEAVADKVSLYGIEVDVRPIGESVGAASHRFETYVVFARTTEVGKSILTFKPDPELRDQVRLMWKRGTNPRVYMPFLPHDFEARNGIDYRGNDLTQHPRASAAF